MACKGIECQHTDKVLKDFGLKVEWYSKIPNTEFNFERIKG